MNAFTPMRRHDATLTAASNGVGRTATTARLLRALSIHEGDSDLGQLAQAILDAGEYYVRNLDDYEDAERACENITGYAEAIAERCSHEVAYALEATA